MKQRISITLLLIIILFFINISVNKANEKVELSDNINDIAVIDMRGEKINLSSYNGKVLLIVNVASKCGYTSQYKNLQKLFEQYKNNGFEILGFPCNDFGGQEPGTNSEIKEFCSINYGVSFKLFDKVKIIGENKSSLYNRLTNNSVIGTGDVKWNFEKFLISRNGKIVKRFNSSTEPFSDELVDAVKSELNK